MEIIRIDNYTIIEYLKSVDLYEDWISGVELIYYDPVLKSLLMIYDKEIIKVIGINYDSYFRFLRLEKIKKLMA